uniref:Uncharacterized protein n=1 Tax=Anopheles coluzzii TaxID=1518534 RepID=A0A8W7Q4N7_ANOCL
MLFLLGTANRMGSMRLQCSKQYCYLYDLTTSEDTFTYQYIPQHVEVLCIENTVMEHIDHAILEGVPSTIQEVIVTNSFALRWISVPRAVKSMMITSTNLRRMDIEANSSLSYLAVSVCDLVKVPDSIKHARGLGWLYITSCKLQGLNMASLCDNVRLGVLSLMRNKIRYVVNTSTRHCGVYDALASVTLSENLLTTVSMELFNVLVRMDGLYLQNNRIRTLAGQLIHGALAELRMDGNKLSSVDLCGWTVPSLASLMLDRNNLTAVPLCVNNFTNTSLLTMRSNRLSNFTIESVAGMSSLRKLDLSCNTLKTVMLSTAHFPADLEMLNIDYNNLEALDLSFVPVRSLEVHVSYNLISSFDACGASRNVSQLLMYDNLIVCAWHTSSVRERDRCNKTDGSVRRLHNEHHREVCYG